MRKLMMCLSVSVIMGACQHNKKPSIKAYNYKPPLENRELINRLQDSIVLYGSSRAYNELASYYVLESWNEELLYYSIIMANKYRSAEGHYYIYYSLAKSRTGERFETLDSRTTAFAKYHLLKAYEMGFESSTYQAEQVFGKGKSLPKSSYYLQEYIKAEQSD